MNNKNIITGSHATYKIKNEKIYSNKKYQKKYISITSKSDFEGSNQHVKFFSKYS